MLRPAPGCVARSYKLRSATGTTDWAMISEGLSRPNCNDLMRFGTWSMTCSFEVKSSLEAEWSMTAVAMARNVCGVLSGGFDVHVGMCVSRSKSDFRHVRYES